MIATNLAIDDKLISEALHVGHHKTKKEAVTTALKEYIAYKKLAPSDICFKECFVTGNKGETAIQINPVIKTRLGKLFNDTCFLQTSSL
jgi:hypothetical protein